MNERSAAVIETIIAGVAAMLFILLRLKSAGIL